MSPLACGRSDAGVIHTGMRPRGMAIRHPRGGRPDWCVRVMLTALTLTSYPWFETSLTGRFEGGRVRSYSVGDCNQLLRDTERIEWLYEDEG